MTVTWEERPGEIVYFEGAVPDFVLTDAEGAVQKPTRSDDEWTWASLPSGTYTFQAGLYPCSGGNSCEPLGDSADTCSDELVVDGEVNVHVRLTTGQPCSFTTSVASDEDSAGTSDSTSYSYLLTASCGERALGGVYAVVERDDVVQTVETVRRYSQFTPEPSDIPTLKDLLAKAESAEPRAEVQLEVDDAGLPTTLFIDHRLRAIDDEECYEVSDLRVLDDATLASEETYQGRPPRAWVLFTGRIAYPTISLTTWSKCEFEIESVRRVDASTMRVVGRESATECSSRVKRRQVYERLTRVHRRGGKNVERVVVVSRAPRFVVDAVVQHGLS